MVVYLVRSFGLMPESVSHDWHVQPSCQRPNRGPPERREFSPGESARKHIRLSSKLDKHTVRRISRQSSRLTEFPDDFHIGNSGSEGGRAASKEVELRSNGQPMAAVPTLPLSSKHAQQYGLPSGQNATFGVHFCAARYGRQEIEKRTYFGGSLL